MLETPRCRMLAASPRLTSSRRAARRLHLVLALVAAAIATLTARTATAGAPSCASAPAAGCRTSKVPEQTRIWLHDQKVNRRDTIVWKWRRGQTTTRADFGDPEHLHGYALCIYDAQGGLLFHGTVPSGGTCNGRPCWRPTGAGFRYRNGAALPDGLTKVVLKPGSNGSAGAIVKGRGEPLDLPSMPITPPITVQLQEESGPCWTATYEASGVRVNDGEVFRAGASE